MVVSTSLLRGGGVFGKESLEESTGVSTVLSILMVSRGATKLSKR